MLLSRFALPTIAAMAFLVLAILAHVGSLLEAWRMVAAGEGWEMAFYFSPVAFLTIDSLLLLSCMCALAGIVLGPRVRSRVTCLVILSASAGRFMTVPWRGGRY
jgi:hypothetical protein